MGAVIIAVCCMGITVQSVWDQASRSLHDRKGKQSHRSVFLENQAVKDFVRAQGVSPGDLAGVLGSPSIGFYWARLGGLKALATIDDEAEYLAASPQERAGAAKALKDRQFTVIVGTGDEIAQLKSEGWCSVPGTSHTFALFLR
jgi:hypothetical protein